MNNYPINEDPEQYQKAQIGLLLAQAGIWRDAGNQERYQEDINDARLLAQGLGFNEIVAQLETL